MLNRIYDLLNEAQKLSQIEFYRIKKYALAEINEGLKNPGNEIIQSNLIQAKEKISQLTYKQNPLIESVEK